MKLISKSKFTDRFYEESCGLIKSTWKPSTEFMTESAYKQEMLAAVEQARIYPSKYFLVYAQQFKYIISPELQLWTAEHIAFEIAKLGVKRFAYVVPDEYISGLSVEQTIEESNKWAVDNPYEFYYFSDEKKAIYWLLGEDILARCPEIISH